MADFACISRQMIFSDEFLELEADEMHIWLTLCVHPMGGRCGIFQGGIGEIASKTKRSGAIVRAAFNRFIELGWLLQDHDWFWVRSRIKHHGHNQSWQLGAWNDAKQLTGSTPLAQQCVDYYSPLMTPLLESQSKRKENKSNHRAGEPLPTRGSTAGQPRLSPSLPDLEALESALGSRVKVAWDCYKAMRASLNVTKKISVGPLFTSLTSFTERGYSDDALIHGLDKATAAEAKADNYVHRTAENYKPHVTNGRDTNPWTQEPIVPKPDLATLEARRKLHESLAQQEQEDAANLARANAQRILQ